MFKSTLIIIWALSAVAFNAHALVVISDIDDTIRKTETLEPKLVIQGLFKRRGNEFKGLKFLYNDFSASGSSFFYISNSYEEIYNASIWLKENNFPKGEVFQRRGLKEKVELGKFELKDDHKEKTMDVILKNIKALSKDEEIYLFGDNAFDDYDVYKKMCTKYQLNCTFFIRDVKAKNKFVSVLTYEPYSLEDSKLIIFSDESDLLDDYRYGFLDQYISPLTRNELYFGSVNSKVNFTKTILENTNIAKLCSVNIKDENCKRKIKGQVFQALNKNKLFDLLAKFRTRS